jgi:hypothetical protein
MQKDSTVIIHTLLALVQVIKHAAATGTGMKCERNNFWK